MKREFSSNVSGLSTIEALALVVILFVLGWLWMAGSSPRITEEKITSVGSASEDDGGPAAGPMARVKGVLNKGTETVKEKAAAAADGLKSRLSTHDASVSAPSTPTPIPTPTPQVIVQKKPEQTKSRVIILKSESPEGQGSPQPGPSPGSDPSSPEGQDVYQWFDEAPRRMANASKDSQDMFRRTSQEDLGAMAAPRSEARRRSEDMSRDAKRDAGGTSGKVARDKTSGTQVLGSDGRGTRR